MRNKYLLILGVLLSTFAYSSEESEIDLNSSEQQGTIVKTLIPVMKCSHTRSGYSMIIDWVLDKTGKGESHYLGALFKDNAKTGKSKMVVSMKLERDSVADIVANPIRDGFSGVSGKRSLDLTVYNKKSVMGGFSSVLNYATTGEVRKISLACQYLR